MCNTFVKLYNGCFVQNACPFCSADDYVIVGVIESVFLGFLDENSNDGNVGREEPWR